MVATLWFILDVSHFTFSVYITPVSYAVNRVEGIFPSVFFFFHPAHPSTRKEASLGGSRVHVPWVGRSDLYGAKRHSLIGPHSLWEADESE